MLLVNISQASQVPGSRLLLVPTSFIVALVHGATSSKLISNSYAATAAIVVVACTHHHATTWAWGWAEMQSWGDLLFLLSAASSHDRVLLLLVRSLMLIVLVMLNVVMVVGQLAATSTARGSKSRPRHVITIGRYLVVVAVVSGRRGDIIAILLAFFDGGQLSSMVRISKRVGRRLSVGYLLVILLLPLSWGSGPRLWRSPYSRCIGILGNWRSRILKGVLFALHYTHYLLLVVIRASLYVLDSMSTATKSCHSAALHLRVTAIMIESSIQQGSRSALCTHHAL